MKNRILIFVLSICGVAFSQTTINLDDQYNYNIIKGNTVTAIGATTPIADQGDIYINTNTGVLYFWDGDSWELTSGNVIRNSEFIVDKDNKELIIIDSEGEQVRVSLDEINTDSQDLANVLGKGADANGTVITNLGEPITDADAATKKYVDDAITISTLIRSNDDIDADILALQEDKEDAANKSIDVTLADPTNTKFPTELAVKTYVDGAISNSKQTIVSKNEINDLTKGIDGGAFYDDAALQTSINDNKINIATNTSDISANKIAISTNATNITNLDARIKTNTTNIAANTTTNTTAIENNNAEILALQNDKEDAANKSIDVTLADATNTRFPTELAVKTYVDGAITANTADGSETLIKSGTTTAVSGTGVSGGEYQIEVSDAAITNVKLADDAVQTENIADGTIATADIADEAITTAKINSGAANQILATNAAGDGVEWKDQTASEVDYSNGTSGLTAENTQAAIDELAASNAADRDTDDENEIQTLTSTDGSITVTPDSEGKDYDFSIDLSGVNTDNQNLESATLSGTDLTISIEDGASAIADLSSLEESSEIAAVQLDVDANEAAADAGISANTNALAAHKLADEDLSATNEIQTLTSTDGSITVTPDSEGRDYDFSIDLSGVNTDNQNLESATLSGTDLTISIEDGASAIADLSSLEESSEIAAVQLDVDANEAAADAGISTNKTAIENNDAEILALQNDKEDTANKSIDVTLADPTNTKFPTELAVKTYVDGAITANTADGSETKMIDGETTTVSGDGKEGSAYKVELKDAAITTVKLVDNAVTTGKINNGSVTASKLAADAEDAGKVATVNPDGTISYTSLNIDDADADLKNELQDLNLSGDILTLSTPKTTDNQIDLSNIDNQTASEVNLVAPINVDGNGDPLNPATNEETVEEAITAMSKVTAKAARVFYPPSVALDASSLGKHTLNLYTNSDGTGYKDQYGSPMIVGEGAPVSIPTYAASELYYYITYYDNTVFDNVTINKEGILSYSVKAIPSDYNSLINVVFVVK